MILKEMVKQTAKTFIDQNFRSESKTVLLDKVRFTKWIDLAHERINALNDYLFLKGHILTKSQVERYIQHGVIFYAKEQLKNLSGASTELKDKIANTKE